MTEAEWLSSDDCRAMLYHLSPSRPGGAGLARGARPSARKLRLFACACVRQVWHLLTDPRSRAAVETAERYVDGGATGADLEAAWREGWSVTYEPPPGSHKIPGTAAASTCHPDPRHIPRYIPSDLLRAGGGTPATQAALLREVVGNPFRPWPRRPPAAPEDWDAELSLQGWRTPTVLSVARRAYDDRDFAALPILADALEEAGCEHEAVLGHLRAASHAPPGWPGHVPGCWCLDVILGKE